MVYATIATNPSAEMYLTWTHIFFIRTFIRNAFYKCIVILNLDCINKLDSLIQLGNFHKHFANVLLRRAGDLDH